MIDIERVPKFYQGYVQKLQGGSIVENLLKTGDTLYELLKRIPEAKGGFRYGDGKWSIKEVVGHITDSERIFCYRSLRFARNDKTDLPGFEQNDYAAESQADSRRLVSLLQEFNNVRAGTIDLFASFNSEMLNRTGTANGYPISVEALGYIIAGHCAHHTLILQERYLNAG